MAIKVIVYWITRDEASIDAIRKHFNIPEYMAINGHTPAEIDESLIPVLEETARRGFLRYWEQDWTFNGTSYSWH